MNQMVGRRVVVTQCNDYMGPAMADIFRREGAEVVVDDRDLREAGACEALIEDAGQVDVLIANLAPLRIPKSGAQDIDDANWQYMFDMMVHPLHRLCRGVLPQMYERRRGKIVVVGSMAGLRTEKTPGKGAAAYQAARTAQVGYVRAVGVEAAPMNVQINLIAQHWTESASFLSKEEQETPAFKGWLKSQPAGRLATGEEDGELALFLASDKSNFITGTSIPFCGGWHL